MVAARNFLVISTARLIGNHWHGDRWRSATFSGFLPRSGRAAACRRPEIARSKISDRVRHSLFAVVCRLRAQSSATWSQSCRARRQGAFRPYTGTHPSIRRTISTSRTKNPAAGPGVAVSAAGPRLRVQAIRPQDRGSGRMDPLEGRVRTTMLPGCGEGRARAPHPAADVQHMRNRTGPATKNGSIAIRATARRAEHRRRLPRQHNQ